MIKQEASGLLSKLGMKTPLSKIPVLYFVLKGINAVMQCKIKYEWMRNTK